MTTPRLRARSFLARYGMATPDLLHIGEFSEQSRKTAERALADLQRDKQVHSFPYPVGKRKVYTLTAKGARLEGLDERRFRGAPTLATMEERIAVLAFCVQTGNELLTPKEFANTFPLPAACEGLNHRRYFIDYTEEQPKLSYLLPDYGSGNTRRIVRKVANELRRRKEHEPFRDLIYVHKLFQIVVITATEQRGREIVHRLNYLTLPHAVIAVPEMRDFLFLRTEE